MNELPSLSLVTPSLNQQKYLRQCLAIVSQHPVEHIVADGASSDGSLDMLAHHKKNVINFNYLSKKDQGMYQALNRGFAMAGGDIFAYINCDDVLLPWSIEMIRAHFAQNPQTDILVADALEWYPGEDRAALVIHPPARLIGRYLRDGGYLAQPAVFFRRRVYEALGGFDEKLKLLGDHVFWLRALQAGFHFSRLWEFVAIQRMVPEQLMQRQQTRAQQESLNLRLKLDLPLLDESRQLRSRALYALLHRLGIARLLFAAQTKQQGTRQNRRGPWSQSLASGLIQPGSKAQLRRALHKSSKGQRYMKLKLDAIGLQALNSEGH